jgi:hypothetical protein
VFPFFLYENSIKVYIEAVKHLKIMEKTKGTGEFDQLKLDLRELDLAWTTVATPDEEHQVVHCAMAPTAPLTFRELDKMAKQKLLLDPDATQKIPQDLQAKLIALMQQLER